MRSNQNPLNKIFQYILCFLLLASLVTAQEQPVAPDEPYHKAQFNFNGAWLPDLDATEIGPSNFQTLQNLRYGEQHPEGIQGYSKINTTALTTYTKIRSGIQLRSNRSVTSYVLVHAENTGETASQVFQNQTAIPDQGDFEATALHTDASGAGLGRFEIVADGHVAYTNGKESYIWSGEQQRIAGVFTVDDSSYTNPVDWTEEANNTLDDSSNTFTVDEDGGQAIWILFTTRPAQAFNYTIKTANAIASTTTAKYWDGDSFAAVANPSDGTADGGASLAQTGQFSFDLPAVKPFHLEGVYLYAYLFEIDSATEDASATISYITADVPWQAMTDVWDGVYRQPIQFQFQDDTVWEDYTLEVNAASTADQAYVADIADFAVTDDEIVIMFEERMAGIRIQVDPSSVNTTASNLTVKYWDGDGWTTVGSSLRDETDTGAAMAQTGLISWSPEDFSDEYAVTKFGTKGYAYQITTSATFNAGKIDLVTGIPAQITVKPFKFPTTYKNRTFLCGYTEGKEGNRCDFSLTNGPDVFNGIESSMDGVQSLYFGGSEEVTAAVQLFNRFGSNVFSMLLMFKDGETYVLRGDGPEDFKIDLISPNIGCPAPLTLATAEVGYELAEGVFRNVAIWLSASGPMIFDGGVLSPIKGIDKYFDSTESVAINFDAIGKSSGWYDPVHREYNLLMPSGSGQTTNNIWLVYDIGKKKWYSKSTGTASVPQIGFQVIDDYGTKYVYAGVDDGRLMRLENGNSWDGTAIQQVLVTGDFWPTGSVWDKTRIRRIKLIAERISESHVVDVLHLSDGGAATGLDLTWSDTSDSVWTDTTASAWTSVGLPDFQMNLSSGGNRITRDTEKVDLFGWAHAFRFEVDTSDTSKGFRPIGMALQYQYVRDDL